MHDVGNVLLPLNDIVEISNMVGCHSIMSDIPVFFKRTKRTAKINCGIGKWKNIVKPIGILWASVHNAFSSSRIQKKGCI